METYPNDLKTALSDLENRAAWLEKAQRRQDRKKLCARVAVCAFVLLGIFLSLWFINWSLRDFTLR